MFGVKKTLWLALLLVLTLVFTACAQTAAPSDDARDPAGGSELPATDETDEAAGEGESSEEEPSGQGTLEALKASGAIRIGVFSDKAPFGYMDEDGELQGYDIYFAKRLARELLGDEEAIEWVILEPANRVEYLESGRVDIVLANFTRTPERAEAVDFALPYMKVALGVVSPVGAPITDVSELEGKQLLIIKGTTAETYFEENHPEIDLIKYDQISEAFQALVDGRGDALSQDNTLLLAWAQENEGFSVGIPSLGDLDVIAPAVQKGNTELLDWINETIEALAEEDFFHENYDATLRPVYGDLVDPEEIVVEGGVL